MKKVFFKEAFESIGILTCICICACIVLFGAFFLSDVSTHIKHKKFCYKGHPIVGHERETYIINGNIDQFYEPFYPTNP